MRFEWEVIDESYKNDTCRAKGMGGWLIRSITYDTVFIESEKKNIVVSESMVFISDHGHLWEVQTT